MADIARFGIEVDPRGATRGAQAASAAFNKIGLSAKASASLIGGLAIAITGSAIAIRSGISIYGEFESALVGVGKTADISGTRLQEFGRQVSDLSTVIPVAATSLLNIAQAAGQLGVKGEEDLLRFTETIARLGVASDLVGEEAATALARILNVTGEAIGQVDVLGSVIVRLGNNFATTERQIANTGTSIAQATASFGVSSTEAVGLAASFSSFGIEAELAGSTVIQTLFQMQDAFRETTFASNSFTQVAGVGFQEVSDLIRNDATGAFVLFLETLNDFTQAGGDANTFLQTFGLNNIRLARTLPTLASNIDLVKNALNTANDEQKENTALLKESEVVFDTLNSKLEIFVNLWKDFFVDQALGGQLLQGLVDGLINISKKLTTISEFSLIKRIFGGGSSDPPDASGGPAGGNVDDPNLNNLLNRLNRPPRESNLPSDPPDVPPRLQNQGNKDLNLFKITDQDAIRLNEFQVNRTRPNRNRFTIQEEEEKDRAFVKRFQVDLEETIDIVSRLETAADNIGDSFGRAFEDAILGARSFQEIASSVITDIGRQILRATVTSQISSFVSDTFSGAFSTFSGGQGRTTGFASGGVINQPVSFGMSSGRGIAGEGGKSEAILPLGRMPNGELGVKSGGNGKMVVNVTQNIQTPNADSFRKSKTLIYNDLRRVINRNGQI